MLNFIFLFPRCTIRYINIQYQSSVRKATNLNASFLLTYLDVSLDVRLDNIVFPACSILIGPFKFQARQLNARNQVIV